MKQHEMMWNHRTLCFHSTSFCTQVEHVRIQQLLGQISLLLRGFQENLSSLVQSQRLSVFCFYLCRIFTKVSWAWWRPEGVNLIDILNLTWINFIERFSAYGLWVLAQFLTTATWQSHFRSYDDDPRALAQRHIVLPGWSWIQTIDLVAFSYTSYQPYHVSSVYFNFYSTK